MSQHMPSEIRWSDRHSHVTSAFSVSHCPIAPSTSFINIATDKHCLTHIPPQTITTDDHCLSLLIN